MFCKFKQLGSFSSREFAIQWKKCRYFKNIFQERDLENSSDHPNKFWMGKIGKFVMKTSRERGVESENQRENRQWTCK